MEDALFGINHIDIYAVLGILVLFSVIEIIAGNLRNSRRTFSDWIQELGGFVILSILIKPAIVFFIFMIGNAFFPIAKDILRTMPFGWAFLLFILVDDLMQYWYHRSAHEYNFMWKLHRPHHQAEEMGFFVSYRNAALFYLLMPNIWWIGLFAFMGGSKAIALGLIIKQIIIIGSHSPTKWDQFLYKYPILHPLATMVERIIVTPAFHFGHHGKSIIDKISDPNGNYGNMLSIWDQIFGTAAFTRKYPSSLGLVNDIKEEWMACYFYPFIKANKTESELSKEYKKEKTTKNSPSKIQLITGESYLWCRCGFSKNQPFCDGSHHGTKKKPLLFDTDRTVTASLCNCKLTKKGPFCDGSHISLETTH